MELFKVRIFAWVFLIAGWIANYYQNPYYATLFFGLGFACFVKIVMSKLRK